MTGKLRSSSTANPIQKNNVIPEPVPFINKHQRSPSIFTTYSSAFMVWKKKAKTQSENLLALPKGDICNAEEAGNRRGSSKPSLSTLLCMNARSPMLKD